MREVNGSELLAGSDHEFVVNLYTVILNRWPDEDGYRHYLQRIENRPDIRRQAIQDVAGSAEARALDVVLTFADDPPPAAGPAAAATVPTGNAGDALAALLATLGTVPDAELRTLHRQLADALGAVAAERDARLEARLARLEQRLG
jgi:hypothetical protein